MKPLILLIVSACACLAQAPTISNLTNAAFPSLDTPPDQVSLVSRSIATIFGTDLADSTVAISPPWQTNPTLAELKSTLWLAIRAAHTVNLRSSCFMWQ
ncbi:MAG TPA: hypothetical protein VLW25_11075 [Bryobacteraceae bacterium]|nr:hypothetical protein [Bryobacteraceae bacterium]